jgi:hypothetical protein
MSDSRKHLSVEEARAILAKTSGYCTYCGRALRGTGCVDAGGPSLGADAWEVDEWEPPSRPNPLHFLWPACVGCKREKGGRAPEEYVVWRWRRGLPTLLARWRRKSLYPSPGYVEEGPARAP